MNGGCEAKPAVLRSRPGGRFCRTAEDAGRLADYRNWPSAAHLPISSKAVNGDIERNFPAVLVGSSNRPL
jgi:hypothetical protein